MAVEKSDRCEVASAVWWERCLHGSCVDQCRVCAHFLAASPPQTRPDTTILRPTEQSARAHSLSLSTSKPASSTQRQRQSAQRADPSERKMLANLTRAAARPSLALVRRAAATTKCTTAAAAVPKNLRCASNLSNLSQVLKAEIEEERLVAFDDGEKLCQRLIASCKQRKTDDHIPLLLVSSVRVTECGVRSVCGWLVCTRMDDLHEFSSKSNLRVVETCPNAACHG